MRCGAVRCGALYKEGGLDHADAALAESGHRFVSYEAAEW